MTKMRHISSYIISILFLWSPLVWSQETENDTIISTPKTERYGLKVGADISKLVRSIYEDNYKGLELVGDYRLTRNYYLAAEIGNENKTTNGDFINFTSKGTYMKFGFDYNMHQNWLDLENMIHLGMRYSISSFSQELNSYKIYNQDQYFGEIEPTKIAEKYSGLSAHWIEIVAGVKTRVFNNVFVGFSVRMHRLVNNQKPAGFDNLHIPGFNRTYDGNFGVGFNYTVTYFIPIYKKKVKTIEPE